MQAVDVALGRLGLGTAQFGMDYGVSNARGKPNEQEVARLLAAAEAAGVGYLDTATGYSDAEALVGRFLSPDSRIRIVTKTPPVAAPRIEAAHKRDVLESVSRSLERLRIQRLHGLLIHHAADLAKPGWEHLVEAMTEAQERGLVDRLGVSVYDPDQLEMAEGKLRIGIAQIPFNILDSRLARSDVVGRLRSGGCEIHARSVFLQGLLLMAPSSLPDFFDPVRGELARLHALWAGAGLTPASACIAYVIQSGAVDVTIVGFNGLAEFAEVRDILRGAQMRAAVPQGEGPSIDAKYIDPSRWPRFRN